MHHANVIHMCIYISLCVDTEQTRKDEKVRYYCHTQFTYHLKNGLVDLGFEKI